MKRILFILTLLSFSSISLISPQKSVFADVYTYITTCDQLQAIPSASNISYILDNDIDCSSINGDGFFDPLISFNGEFNGQNHTITGLTINRNLNNAGLFGTVEHAAISNLNITDANITGMNNVGCIVGSGVYVQLNNVNCTGTVVGHNLFVGGLIGKMSSSFVYDSSFVGDVSSNVGGVVGGLIGGVYDDANEFAEIEMTGSHFDGNVKGESNVAGLIGWERCAGTEDDFCSISTSYATGAINGKTIYAGGLLGVQTKSIIDQCYTVNMSIGITSSAGGLVGQQNGGIINQSYSSNVSVSTDQHFAGGLIGYQNGGIINQSYSANSPVTAGFFGNGGLSGYLASTNSRITDSFSVSQSGSTYLGIYGGTNLGTPSSYITNSYAATSDHEADSYKNNTTVDPLNTWDFSTIWQTTLTYPTFLWHVEPTPTPTLASTPTTQDQIFSPPPSGWSAPNCTDSTPVLIPDLFQIDTTSKSAKLFFTPIDTSQFYISFSTNLHAETYGEQVSLLREGVQSHTIYHLQPNTVYYIKVRGQNGCMPGNWSNIMKFRTSGQIFYKNYSPANYLSSNTIGQPSSKLITSPTITPKSTPIVTQSPRPTETPKHIQTNSQPDSQPSKKCFLWWCWQD